MVAPAEWHSELFADLAAERRWLCKSEMVGICRTSICNPLDILDHAYTD